MIDAIWDNGGKGGKSEARYTFLKNGRVYICKSDGTWEFVTNEQRVTDTRSSLGIPDRNWMDKYNTRMDFSKLPAIIQNTIEEAVYIP